MESTTDSGTLVFIRNIPPNYHSKDLRRYFTTFVEDGRFACFHFRHRPENDPNTGEASSSKSKSVGLCCIARIHGGIEVRTAFIRAYDGKNWTDEKGNVLAARCRIHAARLAENEPLPMELKPTKIMPQGNVGTPTKYFMDAIRECRLPSSVIKRLGLVFPKSSGRRIYSNVPPPLSTGGPCYEATDHEEDEEGEDDAAEEWDRHEAQYDDVTDQDRAKERLYEEDLEIVWEKGGSGLVFYTDAYYWDQEETDTDAKWADDWDVDMNAYVDPNDADKDARDSLAIRRETMLRSGALEESAFKKKPPQPISFRKRKAESPHRQDRSDLHESKTRFGRKIMEKQGWRPGTGLGASTSGKLNLVHDELKDISRQGFDRRGIGYYGKKLDRNPTRRPSAKPMISTVYDNPSETDPCESLLNRHELTWNKHR